MAQLQQDFWLTIRGSWLIAYQTFLLVLLCQSIRLADFDKCQYRCAAQLTTHTSENIATLIHTSASCAIMVLLSPVLSSQDV